MDPLSEVLSLLRPRSFFSGGLDQGGDWALQFAAHDGMKLYAIIAGACWLMVDGVPDPQRLEAGDCILLPHGRPFRLASDLALPPVDAASLVRVPMQGTVRTVNGGGSCMTVGAHFTFAGRHAGVLLQMLPPVVLLRKESDRTAMRWALDRLMLEQREAEPGSFLIGQQIAYVMLVQALRLYMTSSDASGVGWLFALADQQLGAAIEAVHLAPAYRWTLSELGRRAGMSRSTFALKFKRAVGVTPMEYVTRWRMLLAADRLVHSPDSIATVAHALGYESESAFCATFKRQMGYSPRRYGQDHQSAQTLARPLQQGHTIMW